MDLGALAASLRLSLLPENLVHSRWKEGYFSEEAGLPAELDLHLETVNIAEILQKISCDLFSKTEVGATLGWPDLVDEGFDFKRFLYLIHHLLCTTSANKLENEQLRTNGICAAQLYFTFLAIPQGGPFLIYQSNLYSEALCLLKCGYLLRKPEVQSPARRGRGSRQSSDDIQSPTSAPVPLPWYEAEVLRKLLVDAELSLIKALRTCEFKQEIDAVSLTVEALSNIATQETLRPDLLSQGISEAKGYSSSSLAMNAFYGLLTLCSETYGEIDETARLIMRYVFEAMMLGFRKDSKGSSYTSVSAVKDVFIDFVYHVCHTAGNRAHTSIHILLQHLCLYAPEQAESRNKLIDIVVRLLLRLPASFLLKSSIIVVGMSCHDKASVRLFCVEVLGKLLMAMKINVINDKPEESGYNLLKLMFAAVLARIQDLSALVRSRAMTRLTSYLKECSSSEASSHLLTEIFVTPYLTCDSIKDIPLTKFKNFNDIFLALQKETLPISISLPCAQSIVQELCFLCNDDKVIVRKTALQLLVRILHLNVKFMEEERIAEIGSHCRDEAVIVRKMMVQEFTDLLLMYPYHQHLLRQWTIDIVPSIFDSEVTVVEKVLESFERALLDNMVADTHMQQQKHHLPWILTNRISHFQLRKALIKAYSLWKEESLRSRKLIPILQSHIGMDKPYNDSAWVTLACLAEVMTIKDPRFVLDFYHDEIYSVPNVSSYISRLVMDVLWFTWRELPSPNKESLAHELNMDLYLFKVPVPLISRAVDIRYGLHLHIENVKDNDAQNPPEWAVNILKRCEESIFETLMLNAEHVQDQEAMKRFIMTLGNLCLYYPRKVEHRTMEQLMNMLCPLQEGNQELWSGACGVELKAGLIVTLGKIGLQNEQLAKRLIDILGSLLSETKESVLKNNIMICLTDLCIRHTSLGDELLPDMCVCLKDSLQSVRETTLKLLVQLVQEDYIKMRDNLTFCLLSMLNDEDFSIVAMTRVFFVDTVLRKKSNCFTTSFIASIFHYNRHDHYRRSKIPLTSKEIEAFDISGPINKDKRRNIYRFMLSHSSDDDRYTISSHLCIEICQKILDGKISLDEKGEEVLRDCLYVMDCDEIQITDNKDVDEDDTPADEVEVSELVMSGVKKKMLSEMVTKHLLDIGIPTLCKLKRKLIIMHSTLASDVTRVLKNLIQNHKIDTSDIKDSLVVRELKHLRQKSNEDSSSGMSSDGSTDDD